MFRIIGAVAFLILLSSCSSEPKECKLVRLNVEFYKDLRAHHYDEEYSKHYYDDKKELEKEIKTISEELELQIKKTSEKEVLALMKACPLYKEQMQEMKKLEAFYFKETELDNSNEDWKKSLDVD